MAPDREPATRELRQLLREPAPKPVEIARLLDAMTHPERVGAVRALGRAEQRRLYEAVEGFAALRLVHLVPADRRALETVRHFGRNTLPAFTLFEKRFARPTGADPERPDRLYGYNHSPYPVVPLLTGPGYFVARENDRGEVLVDYRLLPEERPPGWPPIRRNDRGTPRLVFGFMVDTVRRVSEHVSIGSAARRGRDLDSYFVLCREA